MSSFNQAIGADIGGTHITCAAVGIETGSIVKGTLSRATYQHDAPAETILHGWASALNGTLSKSGAEKPAGIGFAIPGPFDYQGGISKMRHKFLHLYGMHIPSALRPLLDNGQNLPMRFINDATAFAIGEAWQGEGKGFRRVVVITLGTGFGSAYIEDGLPVVSGDRVAKEGCLWHLPFKDSIADDYFSTKWFLQEYEKQTGERVDGVKTLLDRAGTNAAAKGLFIQLGRNLAECLAPWLKKFDAEVLVIGGNIAHALPLFGAVFQDDLRQMGVTAKVAPSRLEEHAALIGGARLLDDGFWEKVSAQLPKI